MIIESVIKSLNTRDEWRDYFNSQKGRSYLEGTNIRVASYNFRTIELADLTNAFKRGKDCVVYILSGSDLEQLYLFLEKFDYDSQAVIEACHQLGFGSLHNHRLFEGMTVKRSVRKGVNTYSPKLLGRLNPLKEIPKRWMISHVIRLLANNQFKNLRTTNKCTDDYAFDNACNYGEGPYERNLMIQTLVESPSGWWVSDVTEDGGELGINCHHFDYKECTVCLNGAEVKPIPKAKPEAPLPAGILMH